MGLRKKIVEPTINVRLGALLTRNSPNFLHLPIREGCKIKVKKGLDKIIKSSSQTSTLNNPYKPINYSSNSYNFLNAVKSRVTCELTPVDDKEAKSFTRFVRTNMKFFFGGMRNVKSVPFNEYLKNSNATPQVKEALLATHKELIYRGIDENSNISSLEAKQWCVRKTFLKCENLLYNSPYEMFAKAPRVINGGQEEFIDICGPWFAGFQKRLKKVWNVNNFITYSSGLSAEKVGKWGFKHRLFGKWIENDVSKWDSSMRKYLLQIEREIYIYCGAPRLVRKLLRFNIPTVSKSRYGITYKTPDGRKSGDPYTSCGNSILNALLHCYMCCKAMNCSAEQLPRLVKMMIQGDDNALVCKERVDFAKIMKKLGFKAETKHRENLYDVCFCSARFVPVEGSAVLLPLPARVLNKFGTFATNKNMPYNELCAVSAKGLYNTFSFIPLFKQMFDACIKACPKISKTGEFIQARMAEWQIYCSRPIKPSPETWVWLYKYNLGFPASLESTVAMERFTELGTDARTLFYKSIDPVIDIISNSRGLVLT